MDILGPQATEALKHPGAFALHTLKQFQANQGLLLAGAVAYYALLSLVPLLILFVMLLTLIFPQDLVLAVLREYLEFIVPGQGRALVDGLQSFLEHQTVVGAVLFV